MVSACAAWKTPFTVLNKNEKTITLEANNTLSEKEVFTHASKHCSGYGRNAVLTIKDKWMFTFECR